MWTIANIVKIGTILFFMVLIITSGYGLFKFIDSKFGIIEYNIAEVSRLQLAENIINTEIIENSKLLKTRLSLLEKSNKDLINSIKERNQAVTDLGHSVGMLRQEVKQYVEADKVYKNENKPEAEYYFKKIYITDVDGKEFPIAWVMFYPESKTFKYGNYPLEYHTQIILTEGKDASESIVELWAENNQMSETKGKKFPIKVSDFEWIRGEKSKAFSFNPRLSLGAFSGIDSIYPTLGLSFFSYGFSDRDISWRFGTIGVGYNDKPVLGFSPVGYNIGNFLPIIENAFLEPYVYADTDLSYNFGLGISVLF